MEDLKRMLQTIPEIEKLTLVESSGAMELALRLNQDAVHRVGIAPASLIWDVRILTEGERLSRFQYRGEEVYVRVKTTAESDLKPVNSIENWLQTPIAWFDPLSKQVLTTPLEELVQVQYRLSRSQIRHHNLQRVMLVEADIKPGGRNTMEINKLIREKWRQLKIKHLGINLDFSGELDDIQESLDAMPYLFLM